MKKRLFLTLLSAICTLSASAQVWVGGEAFFKSHTASLSDLEISSNKSVGILPEVGYRLSDKWAVALRAGFSHSNDGSVALTNQTLTGNINQFSVTPFVRYTLYQADRFSFLLDAGVGYSLLNVSGYNQFHTIGCAISPALSYSLNDHWALTAHLGKVGYEYLWTEIRNDKLKSHNFNFELLGNLSFGLNYSF